MSMHYNDKVQLLVWLFGSVQSNYNEIAIFVEFNWVWPIHFSIKSNKIQDP